MFLDACLPVVLLVIVGCGFAMGIAFTLASLMMGWIDFRIFTKPEPSESEIGAESIRRIEQGLG